MDRAASLVLFNPGNEERLAGCERATTLEIFRYSFLQQREPLSVQLAGEGTQPGNVSPRPSQTDDEPILDGTVIGCHDDRDAAGRLLRGIGGGRAARHDDVDFQPNQLGGELTKAIDPSFRQSVEDGDVLPLDVAKLAQTGAECLHP